MALVDIAPLLYPNWPQLGSIGSGGNAMATMDALGEGAACVLFPPALGSIRTIGFRTGVNVSGPNLTVAFGIYAVDASGLPNTASPFGGMSPHLKSSGWAASTYYEVDLVADAVISDLSVPIAVGGAISAFTSGSVQIDGSIMSNQGIVPYYVRNLSGSWSKNGPGMCFMLKYADGSVYYIPGTLIGTNGSTASLGSGNARGVKMQMPFACRTIGCVTRQHPLSQLRNHRAVLYDESNNILAQAYRTQPASITTPNGACQSRWNSGAVALTKDQIVRLVILNDDASAMDLFTLAIPDDDCTKQMLGASGTYLNSIMGTARTGAGSWSDSGLGSLNSCLHSLIMDQIDVGGGLAFAKMPSSRLVGAI